MKAWFVLWECHCADARRTRVELPDNCPEHDRVPVVDGTGRAYAEIEAAPGHSIPLGHECP